MSASLDGPGYRVRPCLVPEKVLFGFFAVIGLLLSTMEVFADAPVPPPPAAAASFDVFELRVIGNTMLDARTIERAVYPFTGPAKQMTDIEGARVALERAYHDHGFGTVFVDIPEQSVDEGIVRLRVTEGRLHQVRVTGAKYFSGREIRAEIPAAQVDAVPNLPEMQNQITALNAQTRDRAVIPVLKAGPQPGTVDLALRVEDHLPLHGSVELNNQYTADTTHLRAIAQASYDNMFGRLDSLSAQFQDSPESPGQSHVVAGSYTMRLGSAGSSLALQYINSKSDVATIGTLGVLGTGSVYGLRFMQPLPASGSVQVVALEVDYKDFKQSVLVNSTSGLNTPVKYLNMSAAYSGSRGSQIVQSDWNTTINFGLRGTPDNVEQFADKRFEAQPNYFYLRSDGGLTVQLPGHLSAALRLSGQYAVDPLISNEQFPLGGVASVRGYLEAEELGDSAYRASFQLGAPTLNFLSGRLHLDEFMFYDAGRAYTIDPLPGELRRTDLRSWGAGIKFEGISHLYGTLIWADPLVLGSHTHRGASTLLFVVRSYW